MRISDWSSDVCSSDLSVTCRRDPLGTTVADSFCASAKPATSEVSGQYGGCSYSATNWTGWSAWSSTCSASATRTQTAQCRRSDGAIVAASECTSRGVALSQTRSEEHTSELQSLMRSPYADICLKQKKKRQKLI